MIRCFKGWRSSASGVTSTVLLTACLGGLGVDALAQSKESAKDQILYTLATRCSERGGPAVACSVVAVDEGKATLYRHTIKDQVRTIRITDSPVRMTLWEGSARQWRSLTSASARFSTNTVCFNGRDLCVLNPNYLNSVRQDRPAAMASRDLVKVHFGADGRINATCYDDGCEVSLK